MNKLKYFLAFICCGIVNVWALVAICQRNEGRIALRCCTSNIISSSGEDVNEIKWYKARYPTKSYTYDNNKDFTCPNYTLPVTTETANNKGKCLENLTPADFDDACHGGISYTEDKK
jgi:hypothetical protein